MTSADVASAGVIAVGVSLVMAKGLRRLKKSELAARKPLPGPGVEGAPGWVSLIGAPGWPSSSLVGVDGSRGNPGKGCGLAGPAIEVLPPRPCQSHWAS